jgi:hypothetical protein
MAMPSLSICENIGFSLTLGFFAVLPTLLMTLTEI